MTTRPVEPANTRAVTAPTRSRTGSPRDLSPHVPLLPRLMPLRALSLDQPLAETFPVSFMLPVHYVPPRLRQACDYAAVLFYSPPNSPNGSRPSLQ